MKHGVAESQCEQLWSHLGASMGLPPWQSVVARFGVLADLLLKSAGARKLLSHSQRNVESIWEHVFDSLQALNLILPASEKRILDAGSGNGFPGLPLALALPDVHFSLVERSGSKAEFLEFALARLSVTNASVHVEEVSPRSWPALKPDLVIMRALVPASQLHLLFQKGDRSSPPFVVFTTASGSLEWCRSAAEMGYTQTMSHTYIIRTGTGAERAVLKFSLS